ncbi:MAG: discoidin domain-containing protein, partial [Bacteroidales bacterium]|nr:discoidin domain-containing protein [Bacteroidales bacterium]
MKAYYNVFVDCDKGVLCGGKSMYLNNNVFYNVGELSEQYPDHRSGQFKNNIVYFTSKSQTTGVIYDKVDISHNIFNLLPDDANSNRVINNGFNFGIKDPLLTDPSNGNFYPLANSPVIDKGAKLGYSKDLNGTGVPQNNIPDLGVYEFSGDVIPDNSNQGNENKIPVADAGKDRVVASGTTVTLDASGSYDPDGDALSYSWTFPAGIDPASSTQLRISFNAPEVTVNKSYIITLKVFDGTVYSIADTVIITVLPPVAEENESIKKLRVNQVLASDHDGNVPENAIDGLLETRWSAEGEGEFITFKLADFSSIQYIKASFYKGESRKALFSVQVSEDSLNWDYVLDNVESSGQTADFQQFNIPETDTRFVRIVGYGNSINAWNSINEFEIYGIPKSSGEILNDVNNFTVYPNPSNGQISLDLSGISFREGVLSVYD